MLKIVITSFFGAYFSALLFQTPQKPALIASVVASLGYTIYELLNGPMPELYACYLGTICIVLLCELLARRVHTPTTTMLFPALIPLVPGVGLYKMMYAIAMGDSAYAFDTGIHALMMAGCMALAVASGRMVMVLMEKLRRL